jgi:hypothetical protein
MVGRIFKYHNRPQDTLINIFSDTNTVWDWDSYKEQWVFGCSIFEIISTGSKYNLPIFPPIADSNRHGSVLDSARDVYAIYALHEAFHITSNIALKVVLKRIFTVPPRGSKC